MKAAFNTEAVVMGSSISKDVSTQERKKYAPAASLRAQVYCLGPMLILAWAGAPDGFHSSSWNTWTVIFSPFA